MVSEPRGNDLCSPTRADGQPYLAHLTPKKLTPDGTDCVWEEMPVPGLGTVKACYAPNYKPRKGDVVMAQNLGAAGGPWYTIQTIDFDWGHSLGKDKRVLTFAPPPRARHAHHLPNGQTLLIDSPKGNVPRAEKCVVFKSNGNVIIGLGPMEQEDSESFRAWGDWRIVDLIHEREGSQ